MRTREELIARATEDPGFREQLKADPRGTLERELGAALPDDFEVTVVEESPRHAYLALPPAAAELSQEELASLSAAGGAGTTPISLLGPPFCGNEPGK